MDKYLIGIAILTLMLVSGCYGNDIIEDCEQWGTRAIPDLFDRGAIDKVCEQAENRSNPLTCEDALTRLGIECTKWKNE